jgi:glycerol-3-phosphate dehydrogenase subunit B
MTPSPAGAWRPTWLAPQAQQRRRSQPHDRPIVIVGFSWMRDFYPQLLARQSGGAGTSCARALQLPFDLLSAQPRPQQRATGAGARRPGASSSGWSALLKLVVKPGERVGLPAILGRHAHAADIPPRCKIGLKTADLRDSDPAAQRAWHPPGDALRHALEARGVRVEIGMEASVFTPRVAQLQWVETATSARPLKHRAHVLPAGDGRRARRRLQQRPHGRFWESVFDLPLTVPQDRQWFRPRFLDPAGQPIFRGGVAVNDCVAAG